MKFTSIHLLIVEALFFLFPGIMITTRGLAATFMFLGGVFVCMMVSWVSAEGKLVMEE